MTFDPTGNRVRVKASILADSGIASIVFDVMENETHKSTAKVTDHPVEVGANIADHIVLQPDTLELQARVSNTPIVSQDEAILLTPARAEAAYRDLLTMKNAADTCQVLTTLRAYANMAITAVSVIRNANNGDCLAVTVSLQEIRTATSLTLALPTPNVARGVTALDMGKKATTPANPAVSASANTILKNGLEASISLLDKL